MSTTEINVKTLKAMEVAREMKGATLKEMRLSRFLAQRLMDEGLLAAKDVRHTGKRGRPAHVYTCTDKAHKRVKRAKASGRI